MAYPVVDKPYGFEPVNLLGGRAFVGSTRMVPGLYNYGTALYNGDLIVANGGTAARYGGYGSTTAQANAYGAFMGAEYSSSAALGVPVGPIYGKNRYQFLAANTLASDTQTYVVDDPGQLYRVVALNQASVASTTAFTFADITNSTVGYMSPAFVGTNVIPVSGAGGSAATGNSSSGVTAGNPLGSASSAAGNVRSLVASAFRVVQLVTDTAVTVTTTTTSAISTGSFTVASATGILPGMQCVINGYTGCLPSQYAYVLSVVGTTVVVVPQTGTISAATGVTNSAPSGTSVSFIGYPEVIVAWNAGYQAYNFSTGA
jgi:hypothetical protein